MKFIITSLALSLSLTAFSQTNCSIKEGAHLKSLSIEWGSQKAKLITISGLRFRAEYQDILIEKNHFPTKCGFSTHTTLKLGQADSIHFYHDDRYGCGADIVSNTLTYHGKTYSLECGGVNEL